MEKVTEGGPESAPDVRADGGSAPTAALGGTPPVTPGGGAEAPSGDPSREPLAAKAETEASEAKGGNRRRRTGIALMTATGVAVLAAAPLAVISPKEHFIGESASSTSETHPKHAAAKKGGTHKRVAVPAPSWQPRRPAQPAPDLPQALALPDSATPKPSGSTGSAKPSKKQNLAVELPSNSTAPSADPTPSGKPTPSGTPAARTHPKGHRKGVAHPLTEGALPKASDLAQAQPDASELENGLVDASELNAAVPAKRHKRVRPPTTAVPPQIKPPKVAVPPQIKPPKTAVPPERPHWLVVHGTYVLQPGQDVRTNRMRLSLQTDGDLVLRDEHGRAVWSTGTHASGTHAVFQADGNFVLYSSSNATLWSSRTDGHDGAVLVLRANGDMAITRGGATFWTSGTAK